MGSSLSTNRGYRVKETIRRNGTVWKWEWKGEKNKGMGVHVRRKENKLSVALAR